jgi:C4-dicarboxylate transporter DctM subunit
MPNALGVATITACGIFAAICGSSIANAATVGLVAIPLLREEGYTKAQAGGFVAGGGTLGIIIPPSVPFILYGVLTETSVGKLFMAGVFPGLVMMLLFVAYVTMSRPRVRQKHAMSIGERLAVTRRGIGVLLLPVVIIGAIYSGIFTPTEVAALAVSYVVVLGLVQRRLSVRLFLAAAMDTTKTTAMLLMLIVFGQYFAHFLTFEQIPQQMAGWITGLSSSHFVIVTVMILVYILLGVFLESAAMLLISVPIFYPIAQSIGMDPIAFGVFCCIAMEIAQIHPPIGINLFTIHGISKIPLWDLSKGTLPFLLIKIVMLYAVWMFPQLSLWIPSHMVNR